MENSKEKVKFELIEQFFPCDCRTEGLMCSKIIDDDEKAYIWPCIGLAHTTKSRQLLND